VSLCIRLLKHGLHEKLYRPSAKGVLKFSCGGGKLFFFSYLSRCLQTRFEGQFQMDKWRKKNNSTTRHPVQPAILQSSTKSTAGCCEFTALLYAVNPMLCVVVPIEECRTQVRNLRSETAKIKCKKQYAICENARYLRGAHSGHLIEHLHMEKSTKHSKADDCSLSADECSLNADECSLNTDECSLNADECCLNTDECSLNTDDCGRIFPECGRTLPERARTFPECGRMLLECG
jgi:predicted transcriptional regulator